MPSNDVETKKQKKSKKNKQVEEEQPQEEEQVEEPQEEVEEEPVSKKNKKNKKNKNKEPEPEPEPEPAEEEEEAAAEEAEEEPAAEDEEDEEPVKKSGGKQAATEVDPSEVNKVVKSLEEVSEELIEQFRDAANKVVKKNQSDPAVPLAAALAILTGATKEPTVSGVSVLTQREGFTTYALTKYDDEIRGKSFAFVIIKRMLGEEEGDAAISHLKFTKDRKSLIFDIPCHYDEVIQEKWYSTKSLELKSLGEGELPELEEGGSSGGGGGGGFGGRGGGGRGGRGGFGDRGGRGGRGGFGDRGGRGGRGGFGDRGGRGGRGGFGDRGGKRPFDNGGGFSNNKKIKFDD